jgi:hypothetical protein
LEPQLRAVAIVNAIMDLPEDNGAAAKQQKLAAVPQWLLVLAPTFGQQRQAEGQL